MKSAKRFSDLALHTFASGESFTEALLTGYTAVLCSPKFLYFQAEPGPLTDQALSVRLAYFLWNAPPDQELRELADAGKLRQTETLIAQTSACFPIRVRSNSLTVFSIIGSICGASIRLRPTSRFIPTMTWMIC